MHHISLLKQARSCSCGAQEEPRTAKLEENEIGIPAEDPGKLSRWAAQEPLVSEYDLRGFLTVSPNTRDCRRD